MPKHYLLDRNFFKKWSANMAYVLGYIAADGNISIGRRGNCYLALEGIDKELIEDIRKVLGSNHKITKRNHVDTVSYRLQIGSKEMVNDLISLGITPNKSKRLQLPNIPKVFLGDFVRGYFDGDGNVCFLRIKRVDRKRGYIQYVRVLFTSCSFVVLKTLAERLESEFGIGGLKLHKREKYYLLYCYKKKEVKKIFELFYAQNPALYLNRKLVYFKEALRKINMGAYLRIRTRHSSEV